MPEEAGKAPGTNASATDLSDEEKIEYRACREETRQIAKWATLFFVGGIGLLGQTLFNLKSEPNLTLPNWADWAPAGLACCAAILQMVVNLYSRAYLGKLGVPVRKQTPGKLALFYILFPLVCGFAVSLALASTEASAQAAESSNYSAVYELGVRVEVSNHAETTD